MLNNLVKVEGIVTKCSSVRPKLVKSVHFSEKSSGYTNREYRDENSLDVGLTLDSRLILPQSAMPSKDADGNALDLEHGLSSYKDYQTVTLQEMPERARVGQLPRSVEIQLENDLVDRVKPGDRVQVVGIYRPQSSSSNGVVSAIFKSQLMCNNISIIGKEVGGIKLSASDIMECRKLSTHDDVLTVMSKSLCPSIFGHEFVKKALILQLLGGCERDLENGTHLRGDINVMMVGDPSTAKSQLLRSIMDIAPLAISTTGKGSSGVGLTAAVSMDPETNEKRLEAGAMVLADRGIVCIDEFDKMGENDRVAIHEVMEQQTVTIAKAGIHASLNARCSVLAAANPVYGQYDKSRRPQDNIGLPDSLLSRFDLLFIVLDQLDPVIDRRLSEHVIKSHQYRRPGTIMEPEALHQASTLNLEDAEGHEQDTPVWQRGGRGGATLSENDASSSSDVLTKEFLRKYIHFAKKLPKPTLSEESMESISSAYATMRAKSGMKNLPVTARTLETIIRLSSASAKTRLSKLVEVQDVDLATELINFVLFHEIGVDINTDNGSSSISMNATGAENDTEEQNNGNFRHSNSPAAKRVRLALESQDDQEASENNENNPNSQGSVLVNMDKSDRKRIVMGLLNDLARGPNADDGIDKSTILDKLTENDDTFGNDELEDILNTLESENKVMINGDAVINL